MARIWKEPYDREVAQRLGIHGFEETLIVGDVHSRWIYYVEVCSFRFAFFSLEMIESYLAFYSQKILPSSRRSGPIPHAHDQTQFERLPLYLRAEGKRQKVIKALQKALREFSKLDTP